jgi:hypothetical protein
MKSAIAGLVVAMAWAAPLLAQTTVTHPGVRPEPIVLGVVTGSNSHSFMVNTAKGEDMNFEFDSRTMMPVSLPTGARVRVDFRVMDNGMHYANRITPLEPGSGDWKSLEDQLSESRAMEQRRAEETREANATEENDMTGDRAYTTSSSGEAPQKVGDEDAAEDKTERAARAQNDAKEDRDEAKRESGELPRTAGDQGWLLPAGLAALVLAFGVGLARRRRAA